MRRGLLLIAVLALFLIPTRQAQAYRFGTDQDIHFIQDVKLKGAQEEALYLGHLVETFFVFAGVYVSDKGYVLGVKGDSKKYYDMPTGEKLARFQRAGLLPDPLPPYSLNFFDYAFGYSIWWLIPIVIVWAVWDTQRKKRKAAEAAAANAANPPAAPPSAAAPAAQLGTDRTGSI